MRKEICAPMIALALLLTSACGPTGEGSEAEQMALELRARYLEMDACTAAVEITADYGTRVYQYAVDLDWQREGDTTLVLRAPEEVAGVTARIRAGETVLEYDGVQVETGPLTEDGLSPIAGIPLLVETIREGFLAECLLEEWDGSRLLHITSRDPEGAVGAGMEIQLWFDAGSGALARGEIAQDGKTVLQCIFSDFDMTAHP